jgi:hypothetical protein
MHIKAKPNSYIRKGCLDKGFEKYFRRSRDRMVTEFTTISTISAYHHKSCEIQPVHGEVYLIQHSVIKFVSDLQQVGGFLGSISFLTETIILFSY